MRRLLLVALPFVIDAVVAFALAAEPAPASGSYTIFFDWDQAGLSRQARATIAAASGAAAAGRAALILLAAEEDTVGGAYGTTLTQARWRNTLAELQHDGVVPRQITRTGPRTLRLQPDPARVLAVNLPAGPATLNDPPSPAR